MAPQWPRMLHMPMSLPFPKAQMHSTPYPLTGIKACRLLHTSGILEEVPTGELGWACTLQGTQRDKAAHLLSSLRWTAGAPISGAGQLRG